MAFDLKDYVDVAERIAIFRDKHPDGSLQSEIIEFTETRVAVKAYAYRSPTDERPGIGHAFELIPGKTPYTRDSELQNAETAAWGRAIVAALAADTKKSGIASKQEVGGKGPSGKEASRTDPATAAQVKKLNIALGKAGVKDAERHDFAGAKVGRELATLKELSRVEASALIDELESGSGDAVSDASLPASSDPQPVAEGGYPVSPKHCKDHELVAGKNPKFKVCVHCGHAEKAA